MLYRKPFGNQNRKRCPVDASSSRPTTTTPSRDINRLISKAQDLGFRRVGLIHDDFDTPLWLDVGEMDPGGDCIATAIKLGEDGRARLWHGNVRRRLDHGPWLAMADLPAAVAALNTNRCQVVIWGGWERPWSTVEPLYRMLDQAGYRRFNTSDSELPQ